MNAATAVALGVMAVANAAAVIYFTTRTTRLVSEMASRLQHPDLITHRAALDYAPPADVPSPAPSLHLAGQVIDGDDPDVSDAPVPDSRVA